MTDELSIQPQVQQKSNALPFALGGAAIGGIGGYVGARYTTSPKYASYEDIVKEAEDTFKKNIGEVTEEASVIDKAVSARKAGVDAAANWDAELAKAQEANKNGLASIDQKLIEAQTNAQSAYDNKMTELTNKELETLKKNNTGALTDEQKKVADTLNKKIEKIESTKNAYISAREKAVEAANAEISKAPTSYTYKEFGKTIKAEGNAFEQVMQSKKTFDTTLASVESHLKDKKFKKGSELTFVDPKTKKTVTRIPANAQEVKLAKEYFNKQFDAELKKLFPTMDGAIRRDFAQEALDVVANNKVIGESIDAKKDFLNKKVAEYQKAFKNIPSDTDVVADLKKSVVKNSPAEQLLNRYSATEAEINQVKADLAKKPGDKALTQKLANLKNNAKGQLSSIRQSFYMLQEAPLNAKIGELETHKMYKNIQRANELIAKESGGSITRTDLWNFITGRKPLSLHGLNPAESKELANLQKVLAEAEGNLGSVEYEKVVRAAEKAKGVDANITILEGEVKALQDTLKTRKDAQNTINKITKNIEEWAGKGAKIDNATGKIIKADGSVFVPETGLKLTSKVGVPANDPKVANFERTIARIKAHVPANGTKLTEEQLLEKAKTMVNADGAKTEKAALDAAKKAIEEAKAKLPKEVTKSEAEILKAVEEKLGSREQVIKDAMEKGKEDLKIALERKIPNKKLAAYIAGGAIALGALGYLVAPKNKQA